MKLRLTFLSLLLALSFIGASAQSSTAAGALTCHALFLKLEAKSYHLSETDFAKYDDSRIAPQLILDPHTVNNEKKAYLFKDSLTHARDGALLGLGGDVNLNLAAMGRHKAMFIYDMDPRVIGFHQLIAEAMKSSTTPEQFIEFFGSLNRQELIKSTGSEKLADSLLTLAHNSDLKTHFSTLKTALDENGHPYTFLSTPENFRHVRSLYTEGKVHLYLGSHFDPELFTLITNDIAKSQTAVSTYYVSNSLETRWIMDRANPMTGMLMMMISISGGDRGSSTEIKSQIENELSELEHSLQNTPAPSAQELQSKLEHVSSLITTYQMKASFFEVSSSPWQNLTTEVSQIPFTANSSVLSTTLETAHILGLNNSQYHVLGKEKYETDGGYIEWDYTAFSAGDFKRTMVDAIGQRSHEIYENMQIIANRMRRLIEKIQP